MHTAIATLNSTAGSMYQPGRELQTPRDDKENWDEYEKRVWRERAHYNDEGHVVIPAISFKRCIEAASAYNPRKLKGTATYTKLFERAIITVDNVVLPETRETVLGTSIPVPSDGVSSSKSNMKSSRVWRTFPTIKAWSGRITIHVLDDRIGHLVLRETLEDAGLYIGIGTWRPQRGGLNGRFEVSDLRWDGLKVEREAKAAR
jgi:hypothetical protein